MRMLVHSNMWRKKGLVHNPFYKLIAKCSNGNKEIFDIKSHTTMDEVRMNLRTVFLVGPGCAQDYCESQLFFFMLCCTVRWAVQTKTAAQARRRRVRPSIPEGGSKGRKSYKLVRLRTSSPRSSPSPSACLTIQYKADGPWSFKKSTFLSGWKWDYSDSGFGPSAMRYPHEVGYAGPQESLALFKENVVRELERWIN